jgi:hypothetical protein
VLPVSTTSNGCCPMGATLISLDPSSLDEVAG